MNSTPKRSISWVGVIALGFGGLNLSFFTIGPLIADYGSGIVLLFAVAVILSLISSLGYLELVLMYPEKSGGMAIACIEAFRVYSPVLTNILGVGYWLSWLLAATFGSIYLSTIIQQSLPWVSVHGLSASLITCVSLISLCGLSFTSRFAIPLAAVCALLAAFTVFIPVLSGQVSWENMIHYSFISKSSSTFGTLSSIFAGLYFIVWIVPAYESVLCFVGDTVNPEKNIPRALYVTMGLAVLFYAVCPFIWLGVIGSEAMGNELTQVLSPVFAPLLGPYAKAGVLWFVLFNMLACLFFPFNGPPRTLAQLAKEGLLPAFFGRSSRKGVPWVALLISAMTSIIIIFLDAPLWLIAATNFQYLFCIALASITVWILRRHQPLAPRLYKAPTAFIYLGLCASVIWFLSSIFGFSQYGLKSIIVGILTMFIGLPFYYWRKMSDRIKSKLPISLNYLRSKLTGILFFVLLLDSIGYIVAVNHINPSQTEYISILEDIFILVTLLTLTLGLTIPEMVGHAAAEINEAAKRIVNSNLSELSIAMEALGSGKMSKLEIKSEVIPIHIRSLDELGQMAVNFNHMQDEIKKTALSMNDVQDRLLKTMKQLNTLNRTLETQVVDRTKKLEEEKAKAEEATRIKSEFVSLVGHELRTPMTSIKSSLDLVLNQQQKEPVDAKSYELIKLAQQNAERMLRLITDILNEEKIVSGTLSLHLRNQPLLPLVNQAITSNILFAQKYNVGIQLEEGLIDARANVDADRLMQVLDNILSNAAKFSRPDTDITIRMQRDQGVICISIKDTGEGFSEAFAQKIFSPFTQEDSSGARGGTGLGLSIAKTIIEQHQGLIRFKTSALGSVFFIELPESPE